MKRQIKFGSCLPPFNSCADRFVRSGYSHTEKDIFGMIKEAGKVDDLSGIELVGTWHITDKNISAVKRAVEDAGLQVCMITPDLWATAKWGKGSVTSCEETIRKEAVKEIKKAMDWAAEMNCEMIDVWFGQDGYDYLFQTNYVQTWDWLVEGIRECADHKPEIKICIEYKRKEPRNYIFVSTAGKALQLVEEVKRENVGVLLDIGHALAAGENPAESIAFLSRKGKLFYLHFNDNHGFWDDDMTVGSVHFLHLLETIYWLDKIGYKGWHTLDLFPYRENGLRAVEESIQWIKKAYQVIDKMDEKKMEKITSSQDWLSASTLLRELLFAEM